MDKSQRFFLGKQAFKIAFKTDTIWTRRASRCSYFPAERDYCYFLQDTFLAQGRRAMVNGKVIAILAFNFSPTLRLLNVPDVLRLYSTHRTREEALVKIVSSMPSILAPCIGYCYFQNNAKHVLLFLNEYSFRQSS